LDSHATPRGFASRIRELDPAKIPTQSRNGVGERRRRHHRRRRFSQSRASDPVISATVWGPLRPRPWLALSGSSVSLSTSVVRSPWNGAGAGHCTDLALQADGGACGEGGSRAPGGAQEIVEVCRTQPKPISVTFSPKSIDNALDTPPPGGGVGG